MADYGLKGAIVPDLPPEEGKDYLIDETTAIVRFIFPIDPPLSDSGVVTVEHYDKERIEKLGIDFEPDDTEILKLNTVRKTLYKLYSAKLAQFRRIRDKSTGWFIYYWWHEFDMLEEILIEKKKNNSW